MAPQHLQYADAYHETLVSRRMQMALPESWGITQLEVDRTSLERGTLQVTKLRAVLPDGTLLDLNAEGGQLPASRPIEAAFPHTLSALPVYLTLPVERAGTDNFAQGGAAPARYRLVHEAAHDLGGGHSQSDVPLAQVAPQIRLGDESREGTVSMQVLEVIRGANGTFALSDPYIPPCLRINASPFLMAALHRLLQAMTTRQRALASSRRERSGSTVEFRAEDISSYLLLSTINTYLPALQHFVDAGDCSPRQTYLYLVQLAGQLSTFATNVDPCGFPKFYYTDLRRTFEELFARLMSMLSVQMDQAFVAVTLDSDGTGMYRAALDTQAAVLGCTEFLLAVRTDMPSEQTSQQLPRLCKVASWGDIENILSAATPGAPVEITYRPPAAIPAKADTLYFTIDLSNAFWRNIMAERKFAVYLPPFFDPPQTHIQLLGVAGPKNK